MFNQLFVSDLSERNILTPEQTADVLETQKNTRIRIGTLAEEENLMTAQQVESVNRLQSFLNARFGDIAVKKGFLTEEQVENLLKKQPREHIILKQIICDKKIMNAEQFDSAVNDFKLSLGMSDDVFNLLLDNDVATYISHIAGVDKSDLLLSEYTILFVTLVNRLIDRSTLVKKTYTSNPDSLKLIAAQKATGDAAVTFAFASADDVSAKCFAESFAQCSFDSFDEDAEDSLMEFLNCVTGMLVSELSNSDTMELDIEPPEFYKESPPFKTDSIVLPISLSFGEFFLLIKR
jgi:hypothetical protein